MDKRFKEFKDIRRAVLKARTIAISGHINPDGDSIGSLLALGIGLGGLGKNVYMLCQDEIPPNYKFLPGADRIVKTTNKRVDLAIAVDCGIIDLLDKNIAVFKKAKSILEIDHHEFRRSFGDMQLIDYKASSVGEIIFLLLKRMNIKITQEIAENLLTSIIVETNLFKLPNVRPFIFKMCAELLKTGVNFSELVNEVYGPKTKEAMMLSAVCLLKAKFLKKGRIIWSAITKKDLRAFGARDYEADAIANEMSSMKGVEIAVLFREKSKKVLRVSLRSKGDINIGKLAQEYKGGGHFDIAGFYISNGGDSVSRALSSVEALID
ncbi:MAG: bifunctional oligoribonuclease/PAP phosphatase NrnA [Candidatus Omnitrophota bacterium]|jgi:phosphoesterase RecJ-like protein|nr:bifunctional oligoribonuclease/PAP phosphatase NrnA [Candidatus Omnitrophota bacterium]